MKKTLELFNDVDSNMNFGISRCCTDLMSKLKLLIKDVKLRQEGAFFQLVGETKTINGDIIRLEYEFEATSFEEATKIFKSYKTKIFTTGFKVWMACWKMANLYRFPTFTCNMISLMSLFNKGDKKSKFYSVKEKREFYDDIKRLSKTKLKVFKTVRVNKKETREWIMVPILEILGGTGDPYPKKLRIQILNQLFIKKFIPTIFRNETLSLHSRDIYPAFLDQNRAAQLSWGNMPIQKNWNDLFVEHDFEKTARTNISVAKHKIIKKYNHYKDNNIIKDFFITDYGITLIPKKQKNLG